MYITRLAAAAARAFGMLGGVLQPVITSITSANQNSLTVNWTNKSTTNQILVCKQCVKCDNCSKQYKWYYNKFNM